MPKRKGFYASELDVPAKKAAGANPIGTVALGAETPPIVPKKEAVVHGLGPQVHQFHYPHTKGVHGYGHPQKAHVGHLRLSGSPKAHRVGGK